MPPSPHIRKNLLCTFGEPGLPLSPGSMRLLQFQDSRYGLRTANFLANQRAFQGSYSFPPAIPEAGTVHQCSARVPTHSSINQVHRTPVSIPPLLLPHLSFPSFYFCLPLSSLSQPRITSESLCQLSFMVGAPCPPHLVGKSK